MKATTEIHRKRLDSQHVLGLAGGGAMGYWGTEWLPFLAALDLPVRFVGVALCIYCPIQLCRHVLREQSFREFLLRKRR